MASIGMTSPYANTAAATTTSSTDNSNSSSASKTATDPLANESTFLTLLVSQLKNQNPASPMDGTTFVTQLAQFSDLEQNLAMRNDLDALSSKYAGTSSVPSTTSSGTTPSSDSTPASQDTSANETGTATPAVPLVSGLPTL